MFCMNILHNQHRQLFGIHSLREKYPNILIFFWRFNLIFLISGVKSAHIFGPKEDIVSDP